MKKSILIIGVIFTTSLFVSCGNYKRSLSNDNNYREINNTVAVEDSTKVPGYDPYQRAFAYYLRSLPKEEKQKWVNGTYSETELNNFMDTIDVKKGRN